MQKLDECLDKTRRIAELNEQIEEMSARAMSPKNQVITGMPRGGAGGNQLDNYMSKLERLEARRTKLLHQRDALWDGIVIHLLGQSVKAEYIMLLRYRFYKGFQWRKCCALMCDEYPDGSWNMNKVFRVYRQILRKFAVD